MYLFSTSCVMMATRNAPLARWSMFSVPGVVIVEHLILYCHLNRQKFGADMNFLIFTSCLHDYYLWIQGAGPVHTKYVRVMSA